jgi:hypothetical protein
MANKFLDDRATTITAVDSCIGLEQAIQTSKLAIEAVQNTSRSVSPSHWSNTA